MCILPQFTKTRRPLAGRLRLASWDHAGVRTRRAAPRASPVPPRGSSEPQAKEHLLPDAQPRHLLSQVPHPWNHLLTDTEWIRPAQRAQGKPGHVGVHRSGACPGLLPAVPCGRAGMRVRLRNHFLSCLPRSTGLGRSARWPARPTGGASPVSPSPGTCWRCPRCARPCAWTWTTRCRPRTGREAAPAEGTPPGVTRTCGQGLWWQVASTRQGA